MMRFVLCCAALVLAAAAPAAASPTGPDDRWPRAAAAIDSERVRLNIPGAALAIVSDGRVVLVRGFGVRDLATRLPVDSATVFPIGSCTKAFTGMLAAMAQERGVLSLDNSPHRDLPWFALADSEANARVTLRDMLSHRTGLRGYADLAAEPGVLSRIEYARAATAAKPVAKFRQEFQYSNAMVVSAGELVAKAEGTTWERAIERRIFEPLGMRSSLANIRDLPGVANHATGYDDADGDGTWNAIPPPASLDALAPAGSIGSTAQDMARWLRFMLEDGVIDGRRVASVATMREVATPLIHVRNGWWYGLGWAMYGWNGHRVLEHTGGSQGIAAVMSFMPEKRIGYVILANTTPQALTAVTGMAKRLYPILTGESGEVGALPGVAMPAATAPAAPAAAALDTTRLPSAADVLRRMSLAAGGVSADGRRRSPIEIRGTKRYLNHGVEAALTTRWAAPNRRADEERWRAVGRDIGVVRGWYDGTRGGQETTFGQTFPFTGAALAGARRDANVEWFADPGRAGLTVRVEGRSTLDGVKVLWLEANWDSGLVTRYAVDENTSWVVRRESGGATESYFDYARSSGVLWPRRTIIRDALGETEIVVAEVRELDAVPARDFGPRLGALSRRGNSMK